ncbi:MAG: 3D domain-containing protein [bacterium]
MKSIFGSALIVATLGSSFLLFAAKSSVAETPLSPLQPQKPTAQSDKRQFQAGELLDSEKSEAMPAPSGKDQRTRKETSILPVADATHYVATAYSLRGRTATGQNVSQGIIAADPRVLPLGSRVRLEAGAWSGEYLVADTGGAIRGRRVDIWTPTSREAMRFGRRTVKLTVLSYGGRRAAKKRA